MGVDVDELVVMALLRPDSTLQSYVDTRVYTRVPPEPVYPLVIVRRRGGGLAGPGVHLDQPRVSYEVVSDKLPSQGGAGTRKGTWRIAETVRELLVTTRNTDFAPHGRVTGADENFGPFEIDNDDGRIHLTGEVRLFVHPLRDAS